MNLPESVCAGVAQISSMPVWALLLSKATLLLAVAWLIHFALARANPRWRVLLWRGTVVGLALLVVWSLGLPGLEVRVPVPEAAAMPSSEALPPVVADPAPVVLPQADVFSTEMPASAEMTTAPPQRPVSAGRDPNRPVDTARPSPSWQAALLSLWCLGVALLLARLAIGYLRLARELSTLQAPPEWVLAEVRRVADALGCRRVVRVRSSRRFAVPFLCGLRCPVLVLPERMCQSAYRSQLPAIIAHELAHVRSWDFAWNAGLQVVSILLWFHPLAWRIGSAHRAVCDAVCDAVSASYLGDVQGYCQTLARVALEGAASAPAVGLAMARSCDVRRRITRLQRRVFAAALRRRSAVAFASVGLLSFALLAGLRLALADSAPRETPDQAAAASTPEVARPAPKHQESAPTVSGESVKPGFRPMRIRVLDPGGKPIADAGVTVRGMTHIPSGPARYRTNAEGIATIEFQEHKDLSLQVLAWADRRVTVGAHWRASAVEKTIPAKYTLTLEPGTTLGGIIRDEQGRPVAGAEVTVGGHKQSGDGVLGWSIYDTSQTDAEGKWQCHRVPADLTGFDLNLKVRHPDFVNMPRQDLDTQSVEEFRSKTAVTVMRVGIVVEGTVTDPNGKPVAGAFVEQSVDRFPPGYPPATTDQAGRYRLPVSDPGEYVLAVAAEGHVPNARRVTVSAEERQFDLQLQEGRPIRLRVVDQDGKPLAAALVNTGLDREALSVENTRTAMPGGDRNLSTDAEGRWSRLWIPNDKLTFSISKPGYAKVRKSFAPDDEEHVVTLESGGWTLAGRVVDRETKAPVVKFRVVEGSAHGGPGSGVIWRESRAVEDASGQYRADWDTSGNSRRVVRIEAEGYLPSEARWLKADGKQTTFNVELSKGEAVTGVVLLADGRPLVDAHVALCTASRGLSLRNGQPDLNQFSLIARTDAEGRFSLAPQREPHVLVVMHDQGFAQAEDEGGMKEITVQPWARVEGTLQVDGKPGVRELISIDFTLTSRDVRNPWRIFFNYYTETDAEGHFIFDRVRPGKARICRHFKLPEEGRMSTWTVASFKSVELVSGQTHTVNLAGIEQSAIRERHLAAEERRKAMFSRRKDDIDRERRAEAALKAFQVIPPAARGDRIEAALEVLRSYSIARGSEPWATAIRELIEIGKPAVPKLVAELDRTERHQTLRALGFVLRGIEDPRTVPALIRAIPRTLPGAGDYGLGIDGNPDLLKFMQQYDNSERDDSGSFTYGRPIREIMPALEKITGESHGWLELNFADTEGQGTVQRRIKRIAFRDHAERWADWWSNNWRKYVASETDAQLPLIREAIDRYSESISQMPDQKPPSKIPCGANAIVGGSVSNSRVRSFDESTWGAFVDLDSGRYPDPPRELLANSPGGEPSKELLVWAEQEGVDLIGVKTRLPGSEEPFYALMPLGMKVWRVENSLFENLQRELRFSDELVLPTAWDGLIAQIDEESGKGDDTSTVSFLFITQEGVCGALQIASPMNREVAHGARVSDEGGYRYRFIYEDDR